MVRKCTAEQWMLLSVLVFLFFCVKVCFNGHAVISSTCTLCSLCRFVEHERPLQRPTAIFNTFQRPATILLVSRGRAPSYLICQCCVILGHSFVTFPHHALVRSAGGISCGGDDRHSPDIVCRHRGRNSSHKSPASRALV